MTAQEILDAAARRELLPTELSSAEIREQIHAEIRRRSLFVARGTSLRFLADLANVLDDYLGGQINDATARMRLGESLQRIGYTPEAGFGDNMVPPAEAGTVRDISSTARLQLILDTQAQLMFGAGQAAAGMAPQRMFSYPAWELIRIEQREVPRGQKMQRGVLVDDPGEGWPARWVRAGGQLTEGRMIARKGATIWEELGSAALFDDALDTDHPPFAFNSGMGWRPVDRVECIRLGIIAPDWKPEGFEEWQRAERERAGIDRPLRTEPASPASAPYQDPLAPGDVGPWRAPGSWIPADLNRDAKVGATRIPPDLLEAAKRELDAELVGRSLRMRTSRDAARAAYQARGNWAEQITREALQ